MTADGKPAFPKAVIWVSAREWTSLKGHPRDAPIDRVISPQVRTFEPGAALIPGVEAIALYGHTVGHVAYRITAEGRTIEDIGDLAHSSVVSLAHPEWSAGIDEDQKAGAAMRQAELARLDGAHTLIFAPHFPFPGVGHLAKEGVGYRWVPEPGFQP